MPSLKPEDHWFCEEVFKRFMESGTSMGEFCRRIGYCNAAVSFWFYGKRGFGLSAAMRLAALLKIDLRDFKAPTDIAIDRQRERRISYLKQNAKKHTGGVGPHLTSKHVAEIKSAKDAGETAVSVAKKYNCAETTVFNIWCQP